ncbi:hypothetical protein [Marinifilum flexuosum]|uniref:Uncharacterized protein n=1 Tax=Marinifilum flexuosum TaxID=1117708 RepID=A0A419X2V1_9BACT|nr:hypothetical protein [Marinifilum flexuosum]RKE02055.1 hypothetical protein BXY64_2136 [Marinifilum flexuosum]
MKIYEKIRPFLFLKRDKKSVHYKNLKDGDKIEIDGKEYVKVRLQLVDSLDMDSAKSIDNLETENSLLTEQNKELIANFEELNIKASLLEQLNHNLINHSQPNFSRIKTLENKVSEQKKRIDKLQLLSKRHKENILRLSIKHTDLKVKLDKEKRKVKELKEYNLQNEANQKLISKLESLNNKVILLEQLNKNLVSTDNKEACRLNKRDATITKCNKEINRLNKLTENYKFIEKENESLKIKLAKEKYKVTELLKQLQAHIKYEQVENTEESLY